MFAQGRSRLSRLILLHEWQPIAKGQNPKGHAIFVHGLGGDYRSTFTNRNGEYWPDWIAEENPGLWVWAYSYQAPMLNWFGTALPLQDAGNAMLATFLNEPRLADGPLVFLCHSLGGLLVKQMLREASDQQHGDRRSWVIDHTSGVAFAATPHFGSSHATLLERTSFLLWPSQAAQALVKNDPYLRSLNTWYRNWDRVAKPGGIANAVFYETFGTAAGMVVDPGSGDGGLPGVVPLAIANEDHRTIVKPGDRDALIYKTVSRFVREAIGTAKTKAKGVHVRPAWPEPEKTKVNFLPFVVRLVVLMALGALLFVGARETFFARDPLSKASVAQIERALALKNPELSDEQIDRVIESLREARGEPNFRQAVEQAEKGNTEIAIGIWKQIFERRKAAAREATAEQAQAARSVAANLVAKNVREALEWYRQATDLDAANMEGWIGLGDAAVIAGTLPDAEAAFTKFQNLARATADRKDDILAWSRIGDARSAQGDLAAALKAYSAGLALSQQLADDAPANRSAAYDLSYGHGRIGDIRSAMGDQDGALEAYTASRKILEELVRAEPSNGEWRRGLMALHSRIGTVQIARGSLDEARNEFEAGLTLETALAAAEPENRELQRDLSVLRVQIGDVFKQQGRIEDALQSYELAREIVAKLSSGDPGNKQVQRDLSVNLTRIADMQRAQKDVDSAQKSYEAALAIVEVLASSDPSNDLLQRDLFIGRGRIGEIQMSKGDIVGALKTFQANLESQVKRVALIPADGEAQRDLWIGYMKYGEALMNAGKTQQSAEAYEAALAIARRLATSDASNRQWRQSLAASAISTGDARLAQGDRSAATSAYREGLSIMGELTGADPANGQWQRDQIVAHIKLADVGDDTIANLRKGLEIAIRLRNSGRLAPTDQRMIPSLEKRLKAATGQ